LVPVAFCGGTVDFGGAKFFGGTVHIVGKFSAETVSFRRAAFSGGRVDFGGSEFAGGAVDCENRRNGTCRPSSGTKLT
jgi:hypothetical protein